MSDQNNDSFKPMSRRRFLHKANAATVATVGLAKGGNLVSGATKSTGSYSPRASHKKLRIGVVGGGFGAAFPWHKHPNCEVTAVAELRDDRRRRLEETFQCSNTYGEFHPMLKDSKVDAVAIFTGAPDHVPHCVDVLKSGRHVISAVPAATTLEQCQELADTVKQTGQIYMMAETSCFHAPTMTAREWRKQGKFGRIYYSQADYVHDHGSYLMGGNVPRNLQEMFVCKGQRTWRYGYAQGLYLTHASGPVVSVTGEKLTEVTAIGTPVDHPYYKDNQYDNPFLSTTFFFKTSGANSCRINIHWWSAAPGRAGADYFGTKMAFSNPGASCARPPTSHTPTASPNSMTAMTIRRSSHPRCGESGDMADRTLSLLMNSCPLVWKSELQRSMSIRRWPTRPLESSVLNPRSRMGCG